MAAMPQLDQWDGSILGAAQAYNLDPQLLKAVMAQESNGNPSATSPAGAEGIMQIMPQTARQMGDALGIPNFNPYNPQQAIQGGAWYLAQNLRQYGAITGVKAYNGLGGGPYNDPNYVQNVAAQYQRVNPPQASRQPPPTATAAAATAPAATDSALIRALTSTTQTGTAQAAPAPADPTQDPLYTALTGGKQATPQTAPNLQEAALAALPGQSLTAPGGPAPPPSAPGTLPPIAENKVPGPAFQAAINTSNDPAQRARIAAGLLAKQWGIPEAQAAVRVTPGPGGRLVAVDPGTNTPYYIEPTSITPPGALLSVNPQNPGILSGGWNVSPGNIVRRLGAMVPGAAANALTAGGAAVGGPIGAGVAAGAATAAQGVVARQLDPARQYTVGIPDVIANTAGGFLGGIVGDAPISMGNALREGASVPEATEIVRSRSLLGTSPSTAPPLPPDVGTDIFAPGYTARGAEGPTSEVPYVPPRAELAETAGIRSGAIPAPAPRPGPTGGPAVPEDVTTNPAGASAPASGPHAPTTPAEAAAIPTEATPMPAPRSYKPTAANIESRADAVLRYFHGGRDPTDTANLMGDAGALPSLVQMSGDAGLATLERTLRNDSDLAPMFNEADLARNQAVRNYLEGIRGTDEDFNEKEAALDQQTQPALDRIFASGRTTPTNPSEALAELERIARTPDAVGAPAQSAIEQIRNLFSDQEGNLHTDPAMLHGVKKWMRWMTGPKAAGNAADARAVAGMLDPVMSRLDEAIERGAPGYKAWRNDYAERARALDVQRFLLAQKLEGADGKIQLSRVKSLLDNIRKMRRDRKASVAKNITPQQLRGLETLHQELLRQANIDRGRAMGSPTYQFISTGARQAQAVQGGMMRRLVGMGARTAGTGVGGLAGLGLSGFTGGLVPPTWAAVAGANVGERLLGGAANRLTGADLADIQQFHRLVNQAIARRLLNTGGSGVRALAGGRGRP